MQAAVLTAPGRIELREVPAPVPGPRDLLLRVAAVGLCGTDFHIFAGDANYHLDARGRGIPLERHPQILGHEVVGTVASAGDLVTDRRPGDRVGLDQGLNCHSAGRTPPCEYCATGASHQCDQYRELGITGLPGGLAELVAIPAVNTVPIAPGLPTEQAAVAEPLACVLHSSDMVARAAARYRIDHPDPAFRVRTALICGGGPAGLLFAQFLRRVLRFEGTLLLSEPDPDKRALARRFGAEPVDPTAADLAEVVGDRTSGRRAEYLIEASGAGAVLAAIPGLLRKQGTVLLYGHGHGGTDLSVLNQVLFLEPALVASVGASGGFEADGRPAVYRRALALIEQGTIQVAPLLTHRYATLAEVPHAFAGAHRQPGYVKGIVKMAQ